MDDQITQFFLSYTHETWLILLSLFLLTFLLEDFAIIAGALLIANDIVNPVITGCILFSGIFMGDIGLYYLGRAAHSNPWVHRLSEKKIARLTGEWVHMHTISAIVTSRFIPGLRLPVYMAVGFFNGPFKTFFIGAFFAVILWGALFFTSFFFTNFLSMYLMGFWKNILPVVAIIIFLACPSLIKKWSLTNKKKS